jgi:cytochrome c oxidase assembly protein subunit 15
MTPTPTPSRWLYLWAVLTVLLVFVQLLLGSVVTTFEWGMTDPEWPTAPWYLAQTQVGPENLGKLIEHSHRAFGSVVGVAVIVLAVWLWLKEPRPVLRWAAVLSLAPMVVTLFLGLIVLKQPWVWLLCLGLCVATPLALLVPVLTNSERGRWLRWLGAVALAGVIVQGLFGGFRVCWHAEMGPELRIVHGVLAQVYFAFMASFALLLAPGCGDVSLTALGRSTTPAGLRRASVLAVGLVFCQLVIGAVLRHSMDRVFMRLHLIVAFLVVVAVAGLIWQVFRHRAGDARGKRLAVALGVLIGVQVLIGVEAWMVRFSAGIPPEMVRTTVGHAVVRTAHVLAGALVFALAAVTALWVRRPVVTPSVSAAAPVCELEGVG